MITIRLFSHEVGFEFWPGDWQLGRERHSDAFNTRLYWIGPLHFAVCQMPAASLTRN